MNMQAVILAGGEGKRIRPLGMNKPKSMFEIAGKSLIEYVIQNLKDVNIDDIIIVTAPDDKLSEYLGDGNQFGVTIRYTVQEQPLGQANAILTAESLIDNPFFVLNANDVFDSGLLQNMTNLVAKDETALVLAGREVEDPTRFGVMRIENGKLTGVVEKPPADEAPSNIAVVGVYLFPPDIFSFIRNTPQGDTDDQLERAYQKLIDKGRGMYIPYGGTFESYKFPWDILKISDLLLDRIAEPNVSPSAQIAGSAVIDRNVIIQEGVRVFENAVIRGPAFIGANSIVGNNALITANCSIGRECVIGFGSEIKHSVFGNNVWTHRTYVGDSIVADNCSFGAGTITANFRFDEQNVFVNVKGDRVDTNMEKFGVIMAEGCRTGSNSVLMPGIKIGPNSVVGPGVTLMEDLPPNKIALRARDAYRIRENRFTIAGGSREELRRKL